LREELPRLNNWTALDEVAPRAVREDGPRRVSYLASTLSASLELCKEGQLQLQQLAIFETLYMRRRQSITGAQNDA
jgi:segregation and condensation protein A